MSPILIVSLATIICTVWAMKTYPNRALNSYTSAASCLLLCGIGLLICVAYL